MAVRFDFKEYIVNPSGRHKFGDYVVKELFDFCLDNYMGLEDPKYQRKLVSNTFNDMMKKQMNTVGKINYQCFL